MTILAVFHDLNLAAQFCDLMILMQRKSLPVGKPKMCLLWTALKFTEPVFIKNTLLQAGQRFFC